MKRIITISILLLFAAGQFGYHAVYLVQQYQAKEAMKRRILAAIPENELTVIDETATGNQLAWHEYDQEFSLNGEMYDVVSIKNTDGKKLVYCISDKRENELLKKYHSTVKAAAENDSTGKQGKHNLKYPSFDWISFPATTFIQYNISFSSAYSVFSTALLTMEKKVSSPPPRV